MKKTRYTENQIVKALKEVEGGSNIKDLCRELEISEATYYWIGVRPREAIENRSNFNLIDLNKALTIRFKPQKYDVTETSVPSDMAHSLLPWACIRVAGCSVSLSLAQGITLIRPRPTLSKLDCVEGDIL